MCRLVIGTAVLVAVASVLAPAQQGGPGGGSPLIRQGTELDNNGKYEEARKVFQQAIDSAASPAAKASAQRSMAMSWAFAGNCQKTGEYEQMVIDYWKTREKEDPTNAFYQEGEMANEAARVCVDLGDLNAAERWYKKGTELGKADPGLSADRSALWDFRLEHALARLAARRGNRAEAEKHIKAAQSALDRMTDLRQQQQVFYPYLTGYVAFYLGDNQQALADLQKANTRDAFIQTLIGEVYAKMGDREHAKEWFAKATAARGHNPPAAYAHRVAKKALGSS